MYNQPKLSELSQFAGTDAGSTVIDVWPGSGDWTRLFSDIVGPEGRVYSFVPAELAHFKSDPVGRMRALAKEPGRDNVEVISGGQPRPVSIKPSMSGSSLVAVTSSLTTLQPLGRAQVMPSRCIG